MGATGGAARASRRFAYPESAAAALGHAAARADWLRRPAGSVPDLDRVDTARARELRRRAPTAGWRRPTCGRCSRPTGCRWSPSATSRARRRAWPRPPSSASRSWPRRRRRACTRPSAAASRSTCATRGELREALARVGLPALIQPMVRGGAELLAGVVQDPVFGPLVAFGPGGVLAEIIGDAQVRIAPLTDADAEELVLGGKAGRLVRGFRTAAVRRLGAGRRRAPALAARRGAARGRRARPQPGDRAARGLRRGRRARARDDAPRRRRARRPGSATTSGPGGGPLASRGTPSPEEDLAGRGEGGGSRAPSRPRRPAAAPGP